MTLTSQNEFQWQQWPEAELLVLDAIEAALADLPPSAGRFVRELERTTSTRVLDWVDSVTMPDGGPLASAGFEGEDVPAPAGVGAWWHPGAQLPRVLVDEDGPRAVALKCDRVADVLHANGLHRAIEGPVGGPVRQAALFAGGGAELRVVERHGWRGHVPPPDWTEADAANAARAEELWRTRPRHFDDDAAGMRRTLDLARSMVERVGPGLATALAFAVERDYWQRRNRAAQVQKARQDRMGFGWANHDHHTFRSSRAHFGQLVAIFEAFGFRARERFWAGAEAGWGAQVLEQPDAGIVVFADVDLDPAEAAVDFAHRPLPLRDELGTVGLWCGLHGESMLAAGMHHLELQFDFDRLRDDLADGGVEMMAPFSDMGHLRQAFTVGQNWPVEQRRVDSLLEAGLLDADQAGRFVRDGAIGSHMENLQRRYGFKGFNQKSVSDIIRATDPRSTTT